MKLTTATSRVLFALFLTGMLLLGIHDQASAQEGCAPPPPPSTPVYVPDFSEGPIGMPADITGAYLAGPAAIRATYQEIWGYPGIDPEYLDHYTFLLSTGWKIEDVRADMEALHLQTVVMPVLSIVSLLSQ